MKYKINFINNSYRRFYSQHKKEIDDAIQSCLSRGELTLREEVWDLEKKLAKYIGTKYALTLNSGTDAIFLSLKALGIKKNDEVITVSHTFIAPIQAIVHCGATPILVDVNNDEQIDVNQIEKVITKRTKAILPVHLTGNMCNMPEIMRIAKKHELFVVEDACQALGAVLESKKAGSWGDTGCFSFNTAKLMGAYGDGGAITTNDKKLYQRISLLRNHWNMSQLSVNKEDFPPPKKFEWGWKSRLDNIQAAVLLIKLEYLKWNLGRRRDIAEWYNENFYEEMISEQFVLPEEKDGRVWQEYHLRVKNRSKFVEYLKSKGIETLVRDAIPNHKQRGLGLNHFHLPMTEKLSKEIVRLPLYPEMTNAEIDYVIKYVKKYFQE